MDMCSLMEQKLDLLDARAADLTKRQLQREDTALEYKRCMHACCDGINGDVLIHGSPHGYVQSDGTED